MSECEHENVFYRDGGYECCKCSEWMNSSHYIGSLQSRIASLEEREEILKHEKETLGNDLDEAFDLVCKSDFINQRELLSILERNDDLYGFE